ncbi:hypothetical protein GCM10023231_17550 [Olivibacter ginsenosidimutans]|uniref:N-acetyltransferase domain-containing protein n=1 Tax=Olivibacter ginsenosidimutans TaxID=1176537 RepID=A0ABP9B569_9SPHI
MKFEKSNIEDSLILSEIAFKGKSYWNYGIDQLNLWKDDLTISKNYIENNDVYKLIIKHKIVGFFSLIKSENDAVKLDYLFMFPEYIGQGNGKYLLNKAIEIAKEMNAKKIILDADPNAEKFYEHFGFKKYNELESSIKNRFLPQMELNLDK